MKLAEIEWDVLRGALASLVVVLAIGAVAVGVTDYHTQQLARDNKTFQAALNQIRDRYNVAVQERALIDQFLPQYRKLEKDGFIGDENRLDWIDLLRTQAVRHRILGLSYDVKPRAVEVPPANLNIGEFQLYGSEMKLRMNLLHEGNLLGLLRVMDEQSAGVFHLRACSIERAQREIIMDSRGGNLIASCTLVWHTIRFGAASS